MANPYHLCLETLSNELRFRALELLKQRPMSVSELAQVLGVERSRLSHALSMLKLCKIADPHRRGKEIIYRINPDAWPSRQHTSESLHALLDQHINSQCGSCAKLKPGVA